jgi:hypothetical protein
VPNISIFCSSDITIFLHIPHTLYLYCKLFVC